MLPAKPFYMLRHGQTEANLLSILTGDIDAPLTEAGREQARLVQKVIAALDVKPSVIVHSHLSRARDTASIINEGLALPMYEDPDLGEIKAGDWEGRPKTECTGYLEGTADPPNGETYSEFFLRVQKRFNYILEHFDSPALIVGHSGTFRAFGGAYGLKIGSGLFKNCRLYEFCPAPEKAPFPWEVSSYEVHPRVMRIRDRLFDH